MRRLPHPNPGFDKPGNAPVRPQKLEGQNSLIGVEFRKWIFELAATARP